MNEPTAAAASLSSVRDFPDRLSPMVVKELRQGMRAKYFVTTVVGFHALLWVIMATDAQNESGTGTMGMVWWLFAAVMLIILPLRGLSALTDEQKDNTLDTLVLTNLSAGRIVRGKWLAIAAQITLLAVSVIPYVLMMYLGRGLPLVGLLLLLFRVWLSGLLLTALMVSFSWSRSWLTRTGLAMLSLWLLFSHHFAPLLRGFFLGEGYLPSESLSGNLSGLYPTAGNSGMFWNSFPVAVAEALGMAALGFVFLEFAAAFLGPKENHSTPPRLAALSLLLLAGLVPGGSLYGATLSAFALWTLTAVTLYSLTEKKTPPDSRLQGWRRLNPLSPGLAPGILFSCAPWALLLPLAAAKQLPLLNSAIPRLAAWLFCGRLLMFLLPRRLRSGFGALLILGLGFQVLQHFLKLAGQLFENPDLWERIAVWVPAPLGLGNLNSTPSAFTVAAGGIFLCLLIAVLQLLLPGRHPQPEPETAAPSGS